MRRQAGSGYVGIVLALVGLALILIFGIGMIGGQIMKVSDKVSNSAFGGGAPNLDREPGETDEARVLRVIPPAAGTYGLGQTLDFTLVFSSPVSLRGAPSLPVVTTGGVREALPAGETTGTRIVFRYTVGMLDTDRDGIALGALKLPSGAGVYDLNGKPAKTDFTIDTGAFSRILINGEASRIVAISRPGKSSYKAGQTLQFSVKFSRDVVVLGQPKLALRIGPNRRLAPWTPRAALDEGEGMKLPLLAFSYVIAEDDFIPDGEEMVLEASIEVGPEDAIRDENGNDASRVLPETALAGIQVRNPPLPYGIEAPMPGNARQGESIDLAVTFTRPVTVEGKPLLPLMVGTAKATAEYVVGSGTPRLIFRHAVTVDERDDDGVSVTGAIALNGGTIRDADGIGARLTLPPTRLPDLTVGPFTGYVAVGNYRILASSDGQSWAEHARSIGVVRAVTWGQGRWVAVGDGVVLTSSDATEWDSHPDVTPLRLIGVASGPGGYLMTGGTGYWARSTDGHSWTEIELPFGKPATGLARLDGGFLAPTRAYSGAPQVIFSADGKALERHEIAGETRDFNGVAEGGGRIVMVGAGGAILVGADPKGAWRPATSGGSRTLTDIAHAGGQFIAVGARGTILSSPDGESWARQDTPLDVRLNGVAHGPAGFIAVGAEGAVLQSRDGIQWFDRSQPGGELHDIAYGGPETKQ